MALVEMCHNSKNLYNYVNYIMRQVLTGKLENIPEYQDLVKTTTKVVKSRKDGIEREYVQNFISEFDLSKRLSHLNQVDYRSLKAQCSQQVIARVFANYKSFFKASAEYFRNPGKFRGRPKVPGYKDKNGLCEIVFTNQSASIDNDGFLKLSKDLVLKTVRTTVNRNNFRQARIVPRLDYFQIEIIYLKEDGDYVRYAKEKNKFLNSAAIDVGVDNLAAATSDGVDSIPLVVNGRPLKSINRCYNMRMQKLRSLYAKHKIKTGRQMRSVTSKRNLKVKDYMHKASRRIVDWCILNDVKVLYAGRNKGWKQESDMGKVANQNFVSIPFDMLFRMLRYKLEEVGIAFVEIGEAYTSRCSALDGEAICRHDEYVGKRVKRGLFKTKDGKLLNADVNGSLNILRLGTGSELPNGNRFNPIKLNNPNEVRDAAYLRWRPSDTGDVFSPDGGKGISRTLSKTDV